MPAMKSYLETYRFLQEKGATESHRHKASQGENAVAGAISPDEPGRDSAPPTPDWVVPKPPPIEQRSEGVRLMEGERVVFVEEGGPTQYLKLVASGVLDETLLEALEDYIKRQKKRLAQPKQADLN